MRGTGGTKAVEVVFVGYATDVDRGLDGSVTGTIRARGIGGEIELTCTAGDWLPASRLGLAPRVTLTFSTEGRAPERSVGTQKSTVAYELVGDGPDYALESIDTGASRGELYWDCPAVEWLDAVDSCTLAVTITCDDSPIETLSTPEEMSDPTTPGVAKRWEARPGDGLRRPQTDLSEFAEDGERAGDSSADEDDDRELYTPVEAAGSVIVRHGECLSAIDPETGGAEWTVAEDGIAVGRPSVGDGRLFVTHDGECVAALDAASGETLWRVETDVQGHRPIVGDGQVYVIAGDDDLFALDAASGERMWQTDLDLATPHWKPRGLLTVTAGHVFATPGDELVTVDAESGEIRWRKGPEFYTKTDPAVADGVAMIGTGHRLRGYDLEDGSEKWTRTAHPNGCEVVDGTLYFTGSQCQIAALDPADGEVLWRDTYDGNGTPNMPMPGEGRCYVSTTHPEEGVDCRLYAVDTESGERIWSTELADISSVTLGCVETFDDAGDATGAERLLLAGDRDAFYLFDRDSGDLLWERPTKEMVKGVDSASVVGGTLYVPDSRENVYAIDLATGDWRWRHHVPDGRVDWTTATDGSDQVVVAANGSGVYGLGSSGPQPRIYEGELTSGADGRYRFDLGAGERLELAPSHIPDRGAFRGSRFEVGLALAPDGESATVPESEAARIREFPITVVEAGERTTVALDDDPIPGRLVLDSAAVPAGLDAVEDSGTLAVYMEFVAGPAATVDRRETDLAETDLTLYDHGVVAGSESRSRFLDRAEYGLPVDGGAVVSLSGEQRHPLVPTVTPESSVVCMANDGTVDWVAGPPPEGDGDYRGVCVVDGRPLGLTDGGEWVWIDAESGTTEVSH